MWAFEKISSLLRSPQESEECLPKESTPMDVENSEKTQALYVKLKGYFSLAKREIEKALSAEEEGLLAEAMKHYRAAESILTEGVEVSSNTSPHFQYSKNVNTIVEKIYKWHGEVNERMKVLSQRIGYQQKVIALGRHSFNERKIKLKTPTPLLKDPPRKLKDSPVSTGPSRVKGVDANLAELIENEILDRTPAVSWDSIAGLDKAKQTLLEMVILPMKRSDLFTGLRKPARGLLLFGPPGNGKTMLAKAVASESSATFFSISASSLTSKWVGEGEKLVRALFAIARIRQPSCIFIDEIDSVLSARSANEHGASRRLKSEFLIQFDGVLTNDEERIVVMGATNRPEEIDDAVRRRLVKRIYVPLPDKKTRKDLLNKLLIGTAYALPSTDIENIVRDTDGYSCSDLRALCQEAAMIPIRELGHGVNTVKADQIRPLKYTDFLQAIQVVKRSVSRDQLRKFELWNQEFGSN